MALELTDREKQEIELALYYTTQLNHGTSGHLAYNVIAKLYNFIRQNDVKPDPIRITKEMWQDIGRYIQILLDGRDITDVALWIEPEAGKALVGGNRSEPQIQYGEITTNPPFEELKDLLEC